MTYVDAALALPRKAGQIKLHGPAAFAAMRRAGRLVAECLDRLVDEARPGVTTEHIDRLVLEFALSHRALPATLMYRGYSRASCISVNHVVCHGVPGDKALKDGDIVNIDVTFIVDGWHGDSSRMFAVGDVSRRAERLIDVTFFTVEPMINLGRHHVKVLSDGWTAVTCDRSLSAQFEHTVGVTATGVEIFTLSPRGMHKPPYRG